MKPRIEGKHKKKTIGATDIVDIPSLKLKGISCKIDTGADTSAIHTHHVQRIERDGKHILRFKILDPTHPLYTKRTFNFRNFKKIIVKNSSGDEEERFVIRVRLIIFGKIYKTDFTLANRMEMRYPILLGKKILENNFVVDVSEKDLSFVRKNKRKELRQLRMQSK